MSFLSGRLPAGEKTIDLILIKDARTSSDLECRQLSKCNQVLEWRQWATPHFPLQA
jgi:hypothetical protein